LCGAVCAEETVLPLANPGFEDGLEGWTITEFKGVTCTLDERAASGEHSLHIVDAHEKNGSAVVSTPVEIEGAGIFELRGNHFPVSGSGLGMYVRAFDVEGEWINGEESHIVGLGGSARKWRWFARRFYTSDAARSLQIWIHSYSHAHVDAYLDDLQLVQLGDEVMKPPWDGQYKLRPDETARLTAADVVGPDGIVYPNWTRTGVQGDIPDVPEFCRIEDHGARADDDADDADALDLACVAAGEAGGGAVVLGAGTYYMDRPVTIRHDGVVIRGQGADKTRLIFRYSLEPEGIRFYSPASGATVGPNTSIELHCRPTGVQKMHIFVDDELVGTWTRSTHSGNTFAYRRSGRNVLAKAEPGPRVLKGVGEYEDGSTLTCEIPVTLDPDFTDDPLLPASSVAIDFRARGWASSKSLLTEDGRRGDMSLQVESVAELAVGDHILIDGPATERWKKLTRNACKWGSYRRYEVTIEAIEGNTLTISQPLRIEFPVEDGSYVQKMEVIEGCGIEDMYIEQTENLWITTAQFTHGWNCWARGVTVKMCGRFAINGSMAKWCTIRDCVFDDAWFKGGGGTAYVAWQQSWDCLMEGVETFVMRHAPLVQWATAGCVIRNSVFHDSDMQWHAGWTNENLFENCVVTSVRSHGSYGYGAWASPPEDTAHGPNGPRNVVYNCDISSPRAGLWMGGMNENWLILHNRFVVESGVGVFAKDASFDHIIRGNVFVLKDEKSPMVYLATPDCIGVELLGNRLYGGSGTFADGAGEPAVMQGNEALPLAEDIPRPEPEVVSIYDWQQEHAR
jgi:hypothetical protein